MKRSQKIKVVAIVLICVIVDIVLHIVTTSYSTMPVNADFSLMVSIFGKEITAFGWALLAFSSAAFVYLNIRNEIPGTGVMTGLRYGTSIALLWLCAMLEGVSLFGNPILNEFVVGLSDAIPVFVLGVLLSLLKTKKVESKFSGTFMVQEKIKTISIFTGIFLAGRYIAYFSGVIRSGIHTRSLETFIWTLLMGIAIGTAYVFLGINRYERPLKRIALKFGFLIFGLNWAVFLVFMPFMFSGYIADVFLRIIIDTTLITLSSYLTIIPSGRYIRKYES